MTIQRHTANDLLPLTSLRAFLASWIVYFHLLAVDPPTSRMLTEHPSAWLNTVFCAYVAVGIFFVLSGFILALNYPLEQAWDRGRWARFAAARFSRIYPVYLLALFAVLPIVVSNTRSSGASATLLLRRTFSGVLNLLMLQSWLPQASISWNGPGWSISNEFFFYACFPLCGIWLFRNRSIRHLSATLLALWGLALLPGALGLAAHVHGYSDAGATSRPDFAFAWFISFNPLFNLPFFLSGIVLCRLYLRLRQVAVLRGRGYVFYLPSLLALFALTARGDRLPYALMHNGLCLPAALGLILGLALGDRYLCALLSNRLLVFLGKASFAEYLLHFPVRAAFEALGVTWTPLYRAAYLLVVLAISSLIFHFFEEPLQRKLRALFTKTQRSAQVLTEESRVVDPVESPEGTLEAV
jgi:peptidoglycan/LPS O-acetylase OafA/YrhL